MTLKKNNTNREFITNVVPSGRIKPFTRIYIVHRHAKKNEKSFRITRKMLQGVYAHGQKIKKQPQVIITIPANERENFIIKCEVIKQRKV